MLRDYNPFSERRELKLHCVITLLQPLSHIAESSGNEAALKTMTMADLEGNSTEVPIYSGNAQRNGVMGRRSGIASLFDALGIAVNPETHQTFYAGGYGGSSENDMEWERKVRQFFPYLSLLGTDVPSGVLGKKKPQMIPGRIAIGDAYLICYESIGYLHKMFPPLVPVKCADAVAAIVEAEANYQSVRVEGWLKGGDKTAISAAYGELQKLRDTWIPYLQQELRSATEWMTLRTKVRADSRKSSDLSRHLLNPETITQGGLFDEPQSNKKDKTKDKEKATGQMIASSWCIQAGAQLYSYWCGKGQGITDLEEGALVDALLKFGQQPYLGGQSSTGCGLCSIEFWYLSGSESGKWLSIDSHTQLSSRAEECHQRYVEQLAVYREYLDELKTGETEESKALRKLLN